MEKIKNESKKITAELLVRRFVFDSLSFSFVSITVCVLFALSPPPLSPRERISPSSRIFAAYFEKNATAIAFGPTCVPIVLPIIYAGINSVFPFQSASLSFRYFCR